jgi:hypothetical protein
VLEQGNETVALEGKAKVGEHRALDADGKRRTHRTIGPIDDERPTARERQAQRLTGRLDHRAIDHRDERGVDCRGFHRFGERRGELRVVADGGERLRETLEQGYIGANQENRCHVVRQLGVPRARRGDTESIVYRRAPLVVRRDRNRSHRPAPLSSSNGGAQFPSDRLDDHPTTANSAPSSRRSKK